jgi:hypothetical protein
MKMSDYMKFINILWRIEEPIFAEHPQIRDSTCRRIAVAASHRHTCQKTEDANAILICTDPELYAAQIDTDEEASDE